MVPTSYRWHLSIWNVANGTDELSFYFYLILTILISVTKID